MRTEYRIEGRVADLENWIIVCFKKTEDDAVAFVRTLVNKESKRKNGKRFSEFRIVKIIVEIVLEVEA